MRLQAHRNILNTGAAIKNERKLKTRLIWKTTTVSGEPEMDADFQTLLTVSGYPWSRSGIDSSAHGILTYKDTPPFNHATCKEQYYLKGCALVRQQLMHACDLHSPHLSLSEGVHVEAIA